MVNLGCQKKVAEVQKHSGFVPKVGILGELNQGQSDFEDRHLHQQVEIGRIHKGILG